MIDAPDTIKLRLLQSDIKESQKREREAKRIGAPFQRGCDCPVAVAVTRITGMPVWVFSDRVVPSVELHEREETGGHFHFDAVGPLYYADETDDIVYRLPSNVTSWINDYDRDVIDPTFQVTLHRAVE